MPMKLTGLMTVVAARGDWERGALGSRLRGNDGRAGLVRTAAVLAASALLAGCYVAPYYPYGYPVATTVVPAVPSFDRAWDAALRASADTGIQVTSADRANGHITGSQAGAAVTIDLRRQADNSVQVTFRVADSQDATLRSRWTEAYQQRMR